MKRVRSLCLFLSVSAISVVGLADSEKFNEFNLAFISGAVPAKMSDLRALTREGAHWDCESVSQGAYMLNDQLAHDVDERMPKASYGEVTKRTFTFVFDKEDMKIRTGSVKTLPNRILQVADRAILPITFDYYNAEVLDGIPATLSDISTKTRRNKFKGRVMTFGLDGQSINIKDINSEMNKKFSKTLNKDVWFQKTKISVCKLATTL